MCGSHMLFPLDLEGLFSVRLPLPGEKSWGKQGTSENSISVFRFSQLSKPTPFSLGEFNCQEFRAGHSRGRHTSLEACLWSECSLFDLRCDRLWGQGGHVDREGSSLWRLTRLLLGAWFCHPVGSVHLLLGVTAGDRVTAGMLGQGFSWKQT